jgi:cytochrome b561
MATDTKKSRYTYTAISLHWLIAIAIIGTFLLGLYVSSLPFSPQRIRLISYHKWIGVTIFILVLFRVFWRVTHAAPPLPQSIPRWQQIASTVSHGLLYAFMIAIPVSGWLYSSASGVPVVYLGLFKLPNLISADKALAANLKLVHIGLNFTLAAIVIVHILAALKHHFVDRDNVLVRMLPFLKSPF